MMTNVQAVIPITGGEAHHEQDPTNKYLLQDQTCLPDSIMWNIAANYYNEENLDAFTSNSVPMFVTSNANYAEIFSQILWGRLNDAWRESDSKDDFKMSIVEVGGGHGRFTYLVLRQLMKYKPIWMVAGMPEYPFEYIFTDIAVGNVETLKKNIHLTEFVESGVLDFGIMDCNVKEDQEELNITNLSNDRVLELHENSEQPLVVIANYLFDSLKTDYLQISPTGDVYRAYCAIYSPFESDLLNPMSGAIVGRMSFKWEWMKIDGSDLMASLPNNEELNKRAKDNVKGSLMNFCSPELEELKSFFQGSKQPVHENSNDVLTDMIKDLEFDKCDSSPTSAFYAKSQSETVLEKEIGKTPDYLKIDTVRMVVESYIQIAKRDQKWLTLTMPLGAMMLIRLLVKCRPSSFLIGDKGYNGLHDLYSRRKPHIAVHGSLSFMVNMQALKQFIYLLNGNHISSPFGDHLQVINLMGPLTSSKENIGKNNFMKYYQNMIAKSVERLSKPPDLALHYMDIQNSRRHRTVKSIISCIRCIDYDPDTISALAEEIIEKDGALKLTSQQRLEYDLMRDLLCIHDKWYHLNESDGKLPLTLAFISMRMGRIKHALRFFCDVPIHLREASFWCNVATCWQSLGDHEKAVKACEIALAMTPSFQGALRIKAASKLMMKPLKALLVAGMVQHEVHLLQQILVDGRIHIAWIYGETESNIRWATEVLARAKNNACAPPEIIIGRENLDKKLSHSNDIDIALINDCQYCDKLHTDLFANGIHVLSIAPISVDTSHGTIQNYIENRLRCYEAGSFLNWHHVPGPINKDLINEVQEWVTQPEDLISITIESNITREFEQQEQMSTHENLVTLRWHLSKLITGLLEFLTHLDVSLDNIFLSLDEKSALGWLTLKNNNKSSSIINQCSITSTISAAASHDRLIFHLRECDIEVSFDYFEEQIYIIKRNGVVQTTLLTRPTSTKACLDVFIEHYLQEEEGNWKAKTHKEREQASRRLTLSVDQVLKMRGVSHLIYSFFNTSKVKKAL